MQNGDSFRVAIVQARPELQNLERTLEKTESYIAEAAGAGARLVCFGETWLAGYPAWLDYCRGAALWDHEPAKEVFARMRQNSITVPGAELEKLCNLSASLKLSVVIGVNEKVKSGPGNGTLYNSLLLINESGKVVNHHRKLIPTYTERLVWGQGDGGGLKAEELCGVRVGGLICWEHWMPLARQVMHNSGETIHVSLWPGVHEMHQVASRHYAFEGRCFVLASGSLLSHADLPKELAAPVEDESILLMRGGSAVISPRGEYVAGPVFDKETMLVADLDLMMVEKEKMTLDVTGHYQRNDLFDLQLRLPK